MLAKLRRLVVIGKVSRRSKISGTIGTAVCLFLVVFQNCGVQGRSARQSASVASQSVTDPAVSVSSSSDATTGASGVSPVGFEEHPDDAAAIEASVSLETIDSSRYDSIGARSTAGHEEDMRLLDIFPMAMNSFPEGITHLPGPENYLASDPRWAGQHYGPAVSLESILAGVPATATQVGIDSESAVPLHHDNLTGTDGPDRLEGRTGPDRLFGGLGNDWLLGGKGADREVDDSLPVLDNFTRRLTNRDIATWLGLPDIDSARYGCSGCGLFGGQGDDVLDGGEGQDLLAGGKGNDVLIGGPGSDELIGGEGDDYLFGRKMDDSLEEDAFRDILDGGPGNDKLVCSKNVALAFGGEGDDEIILTDGGRAEGGPGNDRLLGSRSRDLLFGGQGNDVIFGYEGNDEIRGGNGDDMLEGGAGNDNIVSGDGNDVIFGNDGDDWIAGGDGNDILRGGPGDDTIYGGAGRDLLVGGKGRNLLDGGEGGDVYLYRGPEFNGEGDGIQIIYDTGSDSSTRDEEQDRLICEYNAGKAVPRREGNDLLIVFSPAQYIVIKDHFAGHKIEKIDQGCFL